MRLLNNGPKMKRERKKEKTRKKRRKKGERRKEDLGLTVRTR